MTITVETLFEKYLKKYIEILTEGKEAFFIAITDIDKHLVDSLLRRAEFSSDYYVAWFERGDYAKAVQLRNNKNILKIILLSIESVKMIDSLKDFIECPVIPDDKNKMWVCLMEAFGQEFDSDTKKIVETVMEYKQISIEDLLGNLNACMINGIIKSQILLSKLYLFDIWSTQKAVKTVGKLYLKKMVRHSEPQIVEKRLMNGISDGRIKLGQKKQKSVVGWLAKNNFSKIFQEVNYEQVEEAFKGHIGPSDDSGHEKSEEQNYDNSYKYVFQEQERQDMLALEEQFLEEQKKSQQEEEQETVFSDSCQHFIFPDDIYIKEEFEQIRSSIYQMNFSDSKCEKMLNEIKYLWRTCEEALQKGREYTPVYLYHYVQSQQQFLEAYFKLLGKCLSDEMILQTCYGMGFLNKIQNIFCRRKDDKLYMPFYHPVMGLYYYILKQKYDKLKEGSAAFDNEFLSEAVNALAEREQMGFPIRYMLWNNELYQIDDTCLQEWPKEIVFNKVEETVTSSWIDIRLLNEDLLGYIDQHKFLSEINVTIVDINDIREIMSIVGKLRNAAESKHSMANKVILNIVSEKESELKRQLQEQMEMDIDYPQVLFRFTRELYLQEGHYDLDRMIQDSDIMFLADGNILYQSPKLMTWKGDGNWLRIEFENLSLQQLIDKELNKNDNIPEILWDTIHRVEREESSKIACWNTQELSQPLLSRIRKAVEKNSNLTVVLMSSNRQLLQHIYNINGFQVRKSVLPGREMLMVNFHQGCVRKILVNEGEAYLTINLKPFLEELLGISELKTIRYGDNSDETPYLTIKCTDSKVYFLCKVSTKDGYDNNEERKQHYIRLMENIIVLTTLSDMFKKNMAALLYGYADNYKTALMIDYLERIDFKGIEYRYEDTSYVEIIDKLTDSVDVLAFQGMLNFIRKQVLIDEYAVNQFSSIYREEMLKECLEANQELELLECDTEQKMIQLYDKVVKKHE